MHPAREIVLKVVATIDSVTLLMQAHMVGVSDRCPKRSKNESSAVFNAASINGNVLYGHDDELLSEALAARALWWSSHLDDPTHNFASSKTRRLSMVSLMVKVWSRWSLSVNANAFDRKRAFSSGPGLDASALGV